MDSLTLLATWDIWNERNVKFFRNKQVRPTVLLDKIKKEAKFWVSVGAKCLSEIIPEE
jgi:hypothetical protein